MIIAIDGTVSSGKSTIARELAKKLGFMHLNTGAIYRAITVKILNKNMQNSSEDEVWNMLQRTVITASKNEEGRMQVFLDGVDVTGEINSPLISQNVAIYAKIPKVREYVKSVQHRLAKQGNVVIEGRDIGTVVFPNAEVKIFMTADDVIRAKRRQQDYLKQGKNIPLNLVKEEILARDKADMEREISPLKVADNAIIYNNNGNDLEKAVNDLVNIIENETGLKQQKLRMLRNGG